MECYKGWDCKDRCCQRYKIKTSSVDILRISKYLGITVQEFFDMFVDEYGYLKFKNIDGQPWCVFYDVESTHAGCMIHKVKPKRCHQFVCEESLEHARSLQI
jgi:Fe-S-cluster containining protein